MQTCDFDPTGSAVLTLFRYKRTGTQTRKVLFVNELTLDNAEVKQ